MAHAKTKQQGRNPHAFSHDREWVAQRDRFARSGAAGVHADQKTRRDGTFTTNRVGSRQAADRAAIRNDGW